MKGFTRGVVAISLAVFAFKAVPSARATAEDEIRAVEQQMHDAYKSHDVKAFADLYASDSTFTYSSGQTVGKDERVKGFTDPFSDLKDEIQKVRVLGDFAIVNCRSDYTARNGKDHVALQIMRVWVKRSGRWQVIAFQSTPIRSS